MSHHRQRVILVYAKTGYAFRDFLDAARALDIDVVPASDRCGTLDDPWGDSALPLRFEDPAAAIRRLVLEAKRRGVDAIIPVGDRAALIAAGANEALGLAGHRAGAAAAAANKAASRAHCQAAGIAVPAFIELETQLTPAAVTAAAESIAARLGYPVVIKPLALSASRGVMRCDSPAEFRASYRRLERLLAQPEVAALGGELATRILVEQFVVGREVAVEALASAGRVEILAIFDKPDPLDGPFFAETLYITPSRLAAQTQQAVAEVTTRAAAALGLHHGPIHAELRLAASGPVILEVAARAIGGLCGRVLRFGAGMSLEELVLRHATGRPLPERPGQTGSGAGVMMLPVEQAGTYRSVRGLAAARRVPHISGIEITAKPGQALLPLPEGESYMGFIFAQAPSPAAAEEALRRAAQRLAFVIAPHLPMAEP